MIHYIVISYCCCEAEIVAATQYYESAVSYQNDCCKMPGETVIEAWTDKKHLWTESEQDENGQRIRKINR